MSATTRINRIVRRSIPKGAPIRIFWRSSGVSNSQTLRVVTPAWKSLPRAERILKLQRAIEPSLSARERAHIFRISVLTPAEFKRLAQLVPQRHLLGSNGRNGGRLV